MPSSSCMGQFSVRTTIAHPADPERVAVVDLLVDTGATLSWVPRQILEQLGVPRLARRRFLLADGGFVERDTAGVVMRMDGTEAMVTVVVAESGDAHLLGATALETLGFGIDPIGQRLVPQSLLAM